MTLHGVTRFWAKFTFWKGLARSFSFEVQFLEIMKFDDTPSKKRLMHLHEQPFPNFPKIPKFSLRRLNPQKCGVYALFLPKL